MRPWLLSLGAAMVGIALIGGVLPFHDYSIELQPDGTTSLGTIPAVAIRLFCVALGIVPIYLVGSIAAISTRFRSCVTIWKAVLAAFLLSAIVLAWLYRVYRN